MILEITKITPYLTYDLKCLIFDVVCEVEGIDLDFPNTIIAERVNYNLNDIKPLLRPLSDYKKFEDILHEMCLNDEHLIEENPDLVLRLPYEVIEKMLKNHIDVFNLIGNGLALDINTFNIK